MATLADLKARIVLEMVRDELTDAPGGDATAATAATLGQVIGRAIEHHASTPFWFNVARAASFTAASVPVVPRPVGLHRISTIRVTVGSTWELMSRDMAEIDRWASNGPATGLPSDYAEEGGLVRLYPTPLGVYSLAWLGTSNLAALAADTDSNAWTNEAADLIAARSRLLLCRDYFRDVEGATLAASAEAEALSVLNIRGMARTSSTGRNRPRW